VNANKIYVGNLKFGAGEQDIRDFFSEMELSPLSITIPVDRETGRIRGFCFVEFASTTARFTSSHFKSCSQPI